MASLRKKADCRNWFACFSLPDGHRTQRSTGTADRAEAMRIALQFEDTAQAGRQRRLTESQARKTIASIYQIANRETLPTSTVADHFRRWLKTKELETGEKTFVRYETCVRQFLELLGSGARKDIVYLSVADVTRFRDWLAKRRVSAASVNVALKVIRAALNGAVRDGLVDVNQATKVKLLKLRDRSPRKAFTREQLQALLAVAGPEWRGMILTGPYSGARLGDIADLKWENVDFPSRTLSFVARKTGRTQTVPMAPPLVEYFESLPAPEYSATDPATCMKLLAVRYPERWQPTEKRDLKVQGEMSVIPLSVLPAIHAERRRLDAIDIEEARKKRER